MKNTKAISTLVCITLLAAMMLFTRQVLAIDVDTLAGLWLFDEGSGEVVGDSSGNGHDATIIGDPNWVKGKFGEALEFDGVDDLVDTLYIANDQNEAYTVMCWVRLSGKSPLLTRSRFLTPFSPRMRSRVSCKMGLPYPYSLFFPPEALPMPGGV